MSKGLSLESFAADISCNIDTIHEWVKVHHDFSVAKNIGLAKALKRFETIGMAMIDPKIAQALGINPKNINTASWIYQMKCRFNKLGWNPVSADPYDAGDDFEFK